MSDQRDDKTELTKSESLWPIHCDVSAQEVMSGRWTTTQWSLLGFKLSHSNAESEHQDSNQALMHCVALELFKDERTDYRFNLSSQQPKLFLVMENLDESVNQTIVTLTASQSVAGQYMDGDYLVLSHDMPLPVQAWMEAFIGRHGELIEQRRKKRRGAGRASGK
ncbi:DUF3305 domain-containing protein [uncultured Vibrio sp.]|uniref:DUF3305 domain-containing protein n=1 Tax=uncultured Vibrio sp. TaxID=114054 RepID=UPI0009112AEF|nr:DUF3305 domain-containing protein [uncultured Vibrio sp.]OIQ26328.1 MAG: hypothetical protein BM561_00765 [Vibrio sp. MedPE-SWchi]